MALKEDTDMLIKYLRCKKINLPERNDITRYQAAGVLFTFTNEKLSNYYEKNLENKKVLSVTSSGDHILHAVYAGATDITAFDINRFCKYYASLKIAFIKSFDYLNFMRSISNLNDIPVELYAFWEKNVIQFEKDLEVASRYLTYNEIQFWNSFIDENKKRSNSQRLFYNHSDDEKNNIYFNPNNYYKLKNKLYDVNIKFIDSNLDKLEDYDDKYDFIYLSNIISHIYDDNKLYIKVFKILYNILNQDGVICLPGENNPRAILYAPSDSYSKYFIKQNENAIDDVLDSRRIILKRKYKL